MENKDYKFGIVISKRLNTGSVKRIGVCNCGQHIIGNHGQYSFQCENCGNAFFIDATNKHAERFVIPYLEAERKDNRGFKIKRVNLSVIYNGECVVPVKENLVRKMEYDIVDKVLKVWRNDVLEYDYEKDGIGNKAMNDANRMFFVQLDDSVFLDFISNEVTRDMYEVARKMSDSGWNRKDVLLRGLAKLMKDYQWIQILANAGIPNVDRFYRGNRGYYSHEGDKIIDTEKTKPNEILKVPKFMMAYIREDISIDRYVLQQLQGHFKNIDNNKFREIMSVVKDESTIRELANCVETLMQIHIDYDYINLKKLVLYLFREVRLTQGIESATNACTYLRDYIRMSRAMNLEYEKYPKSLKKEHDVVQMNYKVINDNGNKQRLFKLSVEKKSYQNLVFMPKKSKYAVVVPSSSEDLIKEGNSLSHCVASYVNDVTNDKCKILFLRDTEDIEKPLATIEVRGMNIRQARGFANRTIDGEAREFIKNWAEEKNLVEAYY